MITIRLPWPDKRLSPNYMKHWAKKIQPRQAARRIAWALALEAGAQEVKSDRILASIKFHPPDNRRRDDDNMIGAFKAYRDGISDAMKQDDSKWIPTYERGDPVKGGCVVVELRAGE